MLILSHTPLPDIGGGKLIVYVNKFDWNKVTNGEKGDTTNSDTIKLLNFLIDDLGLPLDKTPATTIAKTQNAADGT